MKRYISTLLMLLLFISVALSGCKQNDGSGYLFRYDIATPPQNLDPQSADPTDSSSLLLIENVYEGLLRVGDNGKLTEGVASTYTVSPDGLTYTFTLRTNAKWTDSKDFEAAVTARDFVYGFTRLLNPQTKAPAAAKFFCIKNAQAVYSGQMDPSALGVRATNDYSLTIELEYPNSMFPNLLTTAPAMPCNEQYFNQTKGKYGMDAESTPSNGAFFIKQWQYDPYGSDNHLILRRNAKYSEVRKVYPSGLNFFIEKDESTFLTHFTKNQSDCVVAVGAQAEQLAAQGYHMDAYENTAWGIIFNQAKAQFANRNIRTALANCVDRDSFAAQLPSSFKPAYGLVPADVTMLDKSFRDYAGSNVALPLAKEQAVTSFEQGKQELAGTSLDGLKIIMPETLHHVDYFSYISQIWQKELGFFCTVEVLPEAEYQRRLTGGEYDFALVALQGQYNGPESILTQFTSSVNIYKNGYVNADYDALLAGATRALSLTESADSYTLAERQLMEQGVFIPLYYQTEYFVTGNDLQDIRYNPFSKTVTFANAKSFD